MERRWWLAAQLRRCQDNLLPQPPRGTLWWIGDVYVAYPPQSPAGRLGQEVVLAAAELRGEPPAALHQPCLLVLGGRIMTGPRRSVPVA